MPFVFEDITAEKIMERLLAHIDDKYDKRVGSVIWMALYPAALEMRLHYIDMDMVLRNAFARTADRTHLEMIAEESSIFPVPASSTMVEARFNIQVPIGARFNKDRYNFVVREYTDLIDGFHVFTMESEHAGLITNDITGAIIPITTQNAAGFISDLKTAEIVRVIRPGENVEETEAFRARYFREIKWEHYGGNIADYELMMEKVPGVGAVKVIPVWNGPGTVKLMITDAGNHTPSAELVTEVKDAIDPADYSGTGIGKAPINHYVTVEGVASVPINITLPIVYETDHSWATVSALVAETLEAYMADLRAQWKESERLVVRVSFIESRVIDVPGVLDCQNVLINGVGSNKILDPYEIPVLGEVTAT